MASLGRLALSTTLVILVVAGWVALGEFVYIAQTNGFNHPFFFALLSTCGFILFLPVGYIGWWRNARKNGEFSLGVSQKSLFLASWIPSFCFMLGLYLQLTALPYSTVTVMMLLQDSSTIFTYLFGLVLLKEKSSWRKFLAVVVTIIGMVFVAIGGISDLGRLPGVTVEQSTLGTVAMAISALVWSFYEVWFRRINDHFWDETIGDKDEKDPEMIKSDIYRVIFIQGWSGFIALVMYSWIFGLILSYSGLEVFRFPTCCIEFNPWMIVAWPSNVFLNVALVIATPIFVQVGIGLNVPVAAVADYLIYDIIPNGFIIAGAVFVFSGFGVILWAYKTEGGPDEQMSGEEMVVNGEKTL